jgi:hypothetical protein
LSLPLTSKTGDPYITTSELVALDWDYHRGLGTSFSVEMAWCVPHVFIFNPLRDVFREKLNLRMFGSGPLAGD